MKIKKLSITLMAALLTLSLAACTNTAENTPEGIDSQSQAEENQADDMVKESIEKEDSENNKPAEADVNIDVAKASSQEDDKEDKAKDREESTIDVKKDDNNKEEKVEEKANEKENSEENTDISYQERDGSYISTLLASSNGIRDEQTGIAYLSDVKIEGNTLSIEGCLDYLTNPDSYDNAEEYDQGTYNFKIDENTKFQAVGGLAEPKTFNAQEFIEYYKGVKDSGLGLKIGVENGLVTVVSIAS